MSKPPNNFDTYGAQSVLYTKRDTRATQGLTHFHASAGDEADQKPLSLSEVSEADLQRLGVEDPHRRSSMTVRPSMGDA